MPPPHDDEFYDDEPRGGRRKGLLTVVAVLGLAVIGTAGAFGYRSIFGGAGSSGPPPVIRASGEPSKVAPPPATPDPSASKFSYDRFGDAGKDEQVLRREEKPVDLSKDGAAAAHGVPRCPGCQFAVGEAGRPCDDGRRQSAKRDRRAPARAHRSDPSRSGRRCRGRAAGAAADVGRATAPSQRIMMIASQRVPQRRARHRASRRVRGSAARRRRPRLPPAMRRCP